MDETKCKRCGQPFAARGGHFANFECRQCRAGDGDDRTRLDYANAYLDTQELTGRIMALIYDLPEPRDPRISQVHVDEICQLNERLKRAVTSLTCAPRTVIRGDGREVRCSVPE